MLIKGNWLGQLPLTFLGVNILNQNHISSVILLLEIVKLKKNEFPLILQKNIRKN